MMTLHGVSYLVGDDEDAQRDLEVIARELHCDTVMLIGDERGAGSFQIVDWFADPPRIRGEHPRHEAVRARYLTELIDLYDAEGVHGCFVFTFAMPDFPHKDDPASTSTKRASDSSPSARTAPGGVRPPCSSPPRRAEGRCSGRWRRMPRRSSGTCSTRSPPSSGWSCGSW